MKRLTRKYRYKVSILFCNKTDILDIDIYNYIKVI